MIRPTTGPDRVRHEQDPLAWVAVHIAALPHYLAAAGGAESRTDPPAQAAGPHGRGGAAPVDAPLLHHYRTPGGGVDVARLRSANLATRRLAVIDAVRLLRSALGTEQAGGAWSDVADTLDALDDGPQGNCSHCGDEGVDTPTVLTAGEPYGPDGTGCLLCDGTGELFLCDPCAGFAEKRDLRAADHEHAG